SVVGEHPGGGGGGGGAAQRQPTEGAAASAQVLQEDGGVPVGEDRHAARPVPVADDRGPHHAVPRAFATGDGVRGQPVLVEEKGFPGDCFGEFRDHTGQTRAQGGADHGVLGGEHFALQAELLGGVVFGDRFHDRDERGVAFHGQQRHVALFCLVHHGRR